MNDAPPRWTGKRLASVVAGMLALAGCAAKPPPATKRLPLPGEAFLLAGHEAFLLMPPNPAARTPTPWVLYAPTLPGLPGSAEVWLFERLLADGIAIAGIDVGESFGNAEGAALYDVLYDHLVGKRGLAPRAVLLARSRGGLMTLSWAADRPERVAAFAGIYPVCDLRSYPGLAKAAPAFGTTADGLAAMLPRVNPIERLAPLARARTPFCCVHGDRDTRVPLAENSRALAERVRALGGTVELHVLPGRGHDMDLGFFRSEELLAFVRRHAR
ncbi:MAG TPA: prolyl oligopeptidase family serine peptidase [Planctomycetota bacterium]|nr:prolyl oligopeptidase family serine peptidase [Planctomycetota bacterium]